MELRNSFIRLLLILFFLNFISYAQVNYCLNFDGSNDFLKVYNSNSPPLQLGESYTFEFWFQSGPVTSHPRTIYTTWQWNGALLTGNTCAHLEIRTDGKLRAIHRNPPAQVGGTEVHSIGSKRYDDGQWYHAAVVYDGNTNKMYLYVNGNLNNQSNSNLKYTSPMPANLFIGSNGDNVNEFNNPGSWRRFLHLIDEVRIWNYARSQQEMANDFCKELTLPNNGLMHYYPFNEGSGLVANDIVSGKNAIFVGNPGPDWFFPGFPANMCGLFGGVPPHGPVLWLDPVEPLGYPTSIPNGTYVSFWKDKAFTSPADEEDATQSDPARQPKYYSNGINNKPAILFEAGKNYITGYGWGEDDVMSSLYNPEITSGETDLAVVLDPNWTGTSKTLFIVFKTPTNPEALWQRRQVLFEAGETTSGYNVYIDNGALCFGMWNRFEKRFLKASPSFHDIYDIAPNTVYLAILEFNANTKKFRGIMSRAAGEIYTYWNKVSPNIPFCGITKDPDDAPNTTSTGIGGEVLGTRFHDFNIRTHNYSNTYDGWLGDVILYNQIFTNPTEIANIINYLNMKYNASFSYPDPAMLPAPKMNQWEIISYDDWKDSNLELASLMPNPTSSDAILELYLSDKMELKIELINSLGERVRTIFSGVQSRGIHSYHISTNQLSSGIYFVRAVAAGFVRTESLIIYK